jgi:hypothetical protein
VKAGLLAASVAVALCIRVSAEMLPIVDVRYGYLIGATESAKYFV